MAKEAKKVEGGSEATGALDKRLTTDSPAITVKTSLPRRYRAGRAFGREPVTIPAGELTRENFELLMADPYLAVTAVDARLKADN